MKQRSTTPFAGRARTLRHARLAWLVAASAGVALASQALAEPPTAPPPSAGTGSGAACKLSGLAEPPRNLVVYDAPSGGRPIARLTGGAVRLVVSNLPTNPTAERASLVVDPEGFRITGYADIARLPLYASKPVEVFASHLWLGPSQPLTALAASTGRVQVRAAVTSSIQQTFTTWASCADLSLDALPPVRSASPPGVPAPRGYVAKPETIDLFAAPGDGAPFGALTRSGWSDGIVFHSSEAKKGFVRVHYDADIVVDAWARAQDLKVVPPGELVDQLAPPAQRTLRSSQLKLTTEPAILRTKSELPVRLGAQKTAPVVGAVQPDTELYLIDRVAEWARVLPKSLLLTAPEGEPYWALAADLDAATQGAPPAPPQSPTPSP